MRYDDNDRLSTNVEVDCLGILGNVENQAVKRCYDEVERIGRTVRERAALPGEEDLIDFGLSVITSEFVDKEDREKRSFSGAVRRALFGPLPADTPEGRLERYKKLPVIEQYLKE